MIKYSLFKEGRKQFTVSSTESVFWEMKVVKAERITKNCCILFIVINLLLTACSDLPRDPKQTLQHIEGNQIRVGLVENPPWVIRTNGEPAGAEVELVKNLAQELNATPVWFWGSEQKHLEALKNYELDLVIGGITSDTPWSKEIGLTSPYYKYRVIVGVPASMQPMKDIKGVQVAFKSGEMVGKYLRKKDAVPVGVDDLTQVNNAPVAAPDWEIEELGFTPTEIDLYKEQNVMATPPGENALIKRLDEFLSEQKPEIKNLLQKETAQR